MGSICSAAATTRNQQSCYFPRFTSWHPANNTKQVWSLNQVRLTQEDRKIVNRTHSPFNIYFLCSSYVYQITSFPPPPLLSRNFFTCHTSSLFSLFPSSFYFNFLTFFCLPHTSLFSFVFFSFVFSLLSFPPSVPSFLLPILFLYFLSSSFSHFLLFFTLRTASSAHSPIPNDTLIDIASRIGEKDWAPLAYQLGFTKNDVKNIQQRYPARSREQVYQMLLKWRQKRMHTATPAVLKSALINCHMDDAAGVLMGAWKQDWALYCLTLW